MSVLMCICVPLKQTQTIKKRWGGIMKACSHVECVPVVGPGSVRAASRACLQPLWLESQQNPPPASAPGDVSLATSGRCGLIGSQICTRVKVINKYYLMIEQSNAYQFKKHTLTSPERQTQAWLVPDWPALCAYLRGELGKAPIPCASFIKIEVWSFLTVGSGPFKFEKGY